MIRKALSADPNTLEMLFVENVRATDEMGQWLLDAREAFVSRKLGLRFTDAVVELVAREGFHRSYGARALQRTVEQRVVSALARFLLKDPQLTRATLHIVVEGDQLRVRAR